jgi:hypothetical protein
MSFTKRPSADLIIIVPQDNPTGKASKASWVKLQPIVSLGILALNSTIARPTERTVEDVVVLVAVRGVLEDVEFGGGEGAAAGAAYEALLVVAAGEATG